MVTNIQTNINTLNLIIIILKKKKIRHKLFAFLGEGEGAGILHRAGKFLLRVRSFFRIHTMQENFVGKYLFF